MCVCVCVEDEFLKQRNLDLQGKVMASETEKLEIMKEKAMLNERFGIFRCVCVFVSEGVCVHTCVSVRV